MFNDRVILGNIIGSYDIGNYFVRREVVSFNFVLVLGFNGF